MPGQPDLGAGRGLRRPSWTVPNRACRASACAASLVGVRSIAPLTTVVNTFGGTWFEKDWTPKVNAPEFNRGDRPSTSNLVQGARRGGRRPGRFHRMPDRD